MFSKEYFEALKLALVRDLKECISFYSNRECYIQLFIPGSTSYRLTQQVRDLLKTRQKDPEYPRGYLQHLVDPKRRYDLEQWDYENAGYDFIVPIVYLGAITIDAGKVLGYWILFREVSESLEGLL